jgi:hypothetical protein
MSKSFTRASSQSLTATLSGFQPASITVAVAFKIPSIGGNYHGLVALDNGASALFGGQVTNIATHFMRVKNASGVSLDTATGSTIGSGWEFVVYRFDNTGDTQKIFSTPGDSASDANTNSFPGGNLTNLSIGLFTGNYLDGKIGYVAIYGSALSDTACGNLKAGKHPADATNVGSPAYLWDWVNGSSLTDSIGSITLTNNNSVSNDSGDNPTVDAPPSGGDTLAPTVPASLTLGTSTASTLPFTWSASTDSGGGSVSGYKVQILDNADTVLSTVDVGNVLTYTISSLAGNTLRKLRVAAYDNAVPANQSAYSSSVSGTTLSKTATVTVKDVNGSAQASETSLRWAACTGTIGSALAVVAQGTAETTDGSGNCVLDLNSTALSAGNSITVLLADDSPTARLGVLEAVTVTES